MTYSFLSSEVAEPQESTALSPREEKKWAREMKLQEKLLNLVLIQKKKKKKHLSLLHSHTAAEICKHSRCARPWSYWAFLPSAALLLLFLNKFCFLRHSYFDIWFFPLYFMFLLTIPVIFLVLLPYFSNSHGNYENAFKSRAQFMHVHANRGFLLWFLLIGAVMYRGDCGVALELGIFRQITFWLEKGKNCHFTSQNTRDCGLQ